MTREVEIAEYRRRWEEGDFRAVIDAFEHFHNWSEPLPDWLAGPVHFALEFTFLEGGTGGKGNAGFAKKAARIDRDRTRYLVAGLCLARGRGTTEADTLEQARKMLAGKPAQGSAGAIRASYYRVKNRLQKKA